MSGAADGGRPWIRHYPDDVPATVEVPRVPATWLLDDAVAADATAGALTFDRHTTSYGRLRDDVDRLAGGLVGHGVGAGDRVGIVLPNCPEFVVAFFATLRIGAVVVPCNPLAPADELTAQLTDTGVQAVICLDASVAAVTAATAEMQPAPQLLAASLLDDLRFVDRLALRLPLAAARRRRQQLAVTEPVPATTRLRQLIRASEPAQQVEVDPDTVAVIQPTAGTSGAPRLAMLTHTNLVANALQVRAWLPAAAAGREVSLAVLPLFHPFGLTLGLLTTFRLRGRLVLVPRFDAEVVFAAVDSERATILPAVAPVYRALLDAPSLRGHDLRSIRRGISVGMGLPVETRERFERVSGARVVEAYGLTEATALTHANPMHGERRAGSIGIPLPGTDARIVDPRDPNRELDAGERGELAVRGPQVFAGYWNDDASTAQIRYDGWLLTGDLAVMDADGFFTYVDRKQDVITTGLLKVVPGDVEAVVRELPAVVDCCVVGVAMGRRKAVAAYVVVAADAALGVDEIRAHLSERLPATQVPTVIELRDQLPRSIVGNTLRRRLAEAADEQALAAKAQQRRRSSSTSSERRREP